MFLYYFTIFIHILCALPIGAQQDLAGQKRKLPEQEDTGAGQKKVKSTNYRIIDESREKQEKRLREWPPLLSNALDLHAIPLQNMVTDKIVMLYGHNKPRCKNGNNKHVEMFSPDIKYFVTASEDESVRVWDIASTDSRVLRGFDSLVCKLDMPDNNQLITTCQSGLQVTWDLRANKMVSTQQIKKETREIYNGYWVTGTAQELDALEAHMRQRENCDAEIAYRKKIKLKQAQEYLKNCLEQLKNHKKTDEKRDQDCREKTDEQRGREWREYLLVHHAYEAVRELFLIEWNKEQAITHLSEVLRVSPQLNQHNTQKLEPELQALVLFLQKTREQYEHEQNAQEKNSELTHTVEKEINPQSQARTVPDNKDQKESFSAAGNTSNVLAPSGLSKPKVVAKADHAHGDSSNAIQKYKIDLEAKLLLKADARNKLSSCFRKLRDIEAWKIADESEQLRICNRALDAIEINFWLDFDEQAVLTRNQELLQLFSELYKVKKASAKVIAEIQKKITDFNVILKAGPQKWEQACKLLRAMLELVAKKFELTLSLFEKLRKEMHGVEYYEVADVIASSATKLALSNYEVLDPSLQIASSANGNYIAAHTPHISSLQNNFRAAHDIRHRTYEVLLLEQKIEDMREKIKADVNEMQKKANMLRLSAQTKLFTISEETETELMKE